MTGHFAKQGRGNGARLAGLGENYELGARKEQARDFVDGFIAHCAVDQKNFPVGEILVPEFQQFPCAGGIVRSIDIQRGSFGESFEPAGPAGRSDSALEDIRTNGGSARSQKPSGGGGGERVANLKFTRKRG